MKWMRTLWRWSSLGLSVAALGGIALAGKHWAELHALEAVMGQGAHSAPLTIHWGYSAGCAENVSIPLAAPGDSPTGSRLSARRMWFTYELPALLRKRVVLPRVVFEEAHIVAESLPSALRSVSAADQASGHDPRLDWIEELHRRTATLESDQFVSGTQVAVDTAMLSEQWQANFVDVHSRAQRIVTEAKDIQQELVAMDNPLRQEAKVIASRERLEVLKAELAGLKSSLLKTDKTLREQHSRIREALLTEKRALHETGSSYRSEPASELAETTIHRWLAACLNEPVQYSVLLGELICSPFRHAEGARGSDIRHLGPQTAQFAAGSAKIAGDISFGGSGAPSLHRAPFTASGSFQVLPCAKVRADGTRIEPAHWQMAVGRAMNCISLEGKSRNAREGVAEIQLESSAPGQIEAACRVSRRDVAGTAQVQLREWLAAHVETTATDQTASDDPLVRELLEAALGQLEPAPEEINFRFALQAGATRLTLEDKDTRWLAEQLAEAASAHVAKKYEAAIEKLDAHILAELDAMNRAVAISYNEETQHLQQLLQELKLLQADVMNNLAQRAGSEFARKLGGETVR